MNEEVEDFGLGIKPRLVVSISHHIKNVSEYPHMILGIKQVGNLFIGVDVIEDIFE